MPFRPTTLLRSDTADWWCCQLDVPEQANQGAYAICGVFNGAENWDNNGGQDYKLTVANLEGAVVRAVAGVSAARQTLGMALCAAVRGQRASWVEEGSGWCHATSAAPIADCRHVSVRDVQERRAHTRE